MVIKYGISLQDGQYLIYTKIVFFYELIGPCVWQIDIKKYDVLLVNVSFDELSYFFVIYIYQFYVISAVVDIHVTFWKSLFYYLSEHIPSTLKYLPYTNLSLIP